MLFFLSLIIPSLAILKPPSLPPTLPSSISNQFQDYDLIVHFDSSSNHPQILKRTTRQTYLFNYHHNTSVKLRPEGYKFINLVFLKDPFRFQEFTTQSYNFIQDDFVVFATKKLQGDKIWLMKGLNRAAGVFVFETTPRKLSHCCYYCGNSSGVLKEVTGELRGLLNDYSNFQGHVFRVAFTNFLPFFIKEVGEDRPWGAEGRLLHHFCKFLNFRVDLLEFQSSPNQGAWQKMVKAVENKEVDWAVGGISVSIKRGLFTDFTRYIKTQGFSVVYAVYQDTWVAFESVLFVFQWTIWVVITITIILICLIATMAERMFRGRGSFSKFLRICLVAIAEQPTSSLHIRGFTVRSLFLIWWLTSLSLTTTYKSQLASCLIKPKYNQPNKVDELVEKDFKFHIGKENWSVLKENIDNSRDNIYGRILRQSEFNMSFCEAILALNKRKLAVIAEESYLQHRTFKECQSVIPLRSNLRLVNENLFPNTYHAWPMVMGTPFRTKFSRTISRMEAHGLIHYWYRNMSSYKIPRSNSRSRTSEESSLTIAQMLPPLMILTIGLCVSVVVFVTEILK